MRIPFLCVANAARSQMAEGQGPKPADEVPEYLVPGKGAAAPERTDPCWKYRVSARRIDSHGSEATTKEARIVLDTDVAGRDDAFNTMRREFD